MEHSGMMQAEVVETIEFGDDRFRPWPVWWSAIWVGALTALAVALVIGLAGVAVGAHQAVARPIVDWGDVGLATLGFSVLGTFLAFAAGGWAAGKVTGIRRAETAMLHGAIVWAVSVPLLLGLVALGAGALFGE
jgi:hypothetical protein